MKNIATETIKITSNNPNLLCGVLIIFGVFTILYVVLWIKFNTDRQHKLIHLKSQLENIHHKIRSDYQKKLKRQQALNAKKKNTTQG